MSNQALQVYQKDLEKVSGYFQAALPSVARQYLRPERLTRVVLNALSRSPQLMSCTRPSILLAVMDLVQVGLEPGGPLGHAYLVPFRNNKTGKQEATPIIGYKGYIALAMRSGQFSAPPASNLVREADNLTLNLGDPTQGIGHGFDPKLSIEDRGAVVGAYCIAAYKGGGFAKEYMTIGEIDTVKKRSRASKSKHSPWHTDEPQMQRKTVVRRAKNYWALSGDMAQAFEIDERADLGHQRADPAVMFDSEFVGELQGIPETIDSEDAVASDGTQEVLDHVRGQKSSSGPQGLGQVLCAVPDCNCDAMPDGIHCKEHKE